MIGGALSQAILLGRTVREATAQGRDPVAAWYVRRLPPVSWRRHQGCRQG